MTVRSNKRRTYKVSAVFYDDSIEEFERQKAKRGFKTNSDYIRSLVEGDIVSLSPSMETLELKEKVEDLNRSLDEKSAELQNEIEKRKAFDAALSRLRKVIMGVQHALISNDFSILEKQSLLDYRSSDIEGIDVLVIRNINRTIRTLVKIGINFENSGELKYLIDCIETALNNLSPEMLDPALEKEYKRPADMRDSLSVVKNIRTVIETVKNNVNNLQNRLNEKDEALTGARNNYILITNAILKSNVKELDVRLEGVSIPQETIDKLGEQISKVSDFDKVAGKLEDSTDSMQRWANSYNLLKEAVLNADPKELDTDIKKMGMQKYHDDLVEQINKISQNTVLKDRLVSLEHSNKRFEKIVNSPRLSEALNILWRVICPKKKANS